MKFREYVTEAFNAKKRIQFLENQLKKILKLSKGNTTEIDPWDNEELNDIVADWWTAIDQLTQEIEKGKELPEIDKVYMPWKKAMGDFEKNPDKNAKKMQQAYMKLHNVMKKLSAGI
jgi:hypothetical protein